MKFPINNIIDLAFPRICIVCREKLSTDKWLCAKCIENLENNSAYREACPLCGQNRQLRRCTCEYHWPQPFESIYSLFDFDDTIKAIVHEFKYGGKKRLAFDMGKAFGEAVPASFFEGMDAMVPVPLHFFRSLKRGYNQADHFARGLARCRKEGIAYMPDVLVRKRITKSQTKLSRSVRQANVAGAFAVSKRKKDRVSGKNIIIIDDIVTTAATTAECARALLSAGCGKIRVLSLARD